MNLARKILRQLNAPENDFPYFFYTIFWILFIYGGCGVICGYLGISSLETEASQKQYKVLLYIILIETILISSFDLAFMKNFQKTYIAIHEEMLDKFFNDFNMATVLQEFQNKLHCCGSNQTTIPDSEVVPSSCCDLPTDEDYPSTTCFQVDIADDQKIPCLTRIYDKQYGKIKTILLVFFCLPLVMIFSNCLFKKSGKEL